MRIAYVVLHLEEIIMKGGVGKKISAQLRIWQEMGHSAHLFLHSPDKLEYVDTSTFTYHSGQNDKLVRSLDREYQRCRVLKMMLDQIKVYQPDVIYLRYGMFCIPLQEIFRIAPVIVEINGDDINEYRYRGHIYYWLNRLTRPVTMGRAVGYVALSNEIARLTSNTIYNKPTLTLANGVDMRLYPSLPAPSNETPRLAMVFSAVFPWHGLDKLIWLAEKFPDLNFDLAGYGLETRTQSMPANIHFYGSLDPGPLRDMLAKADVAVGTLALHRKQMEEASPLKVRESLAYGIPNIIAYSDTDLVDMNTQCLLTIPNCEDNVEQSADVIHRFAYSMKGKRVDRDIIAPRIDQRIKEKKRLDFFESLVETG